jgi:hypothetical protein
MQGFSRTISVVENSNLLNKLIDNIKKDGIDKVRGFIKK